LEINMDKPKTITRRQAVLGLAAGVAVAAVGVPAVVAATPSSPVLAAIAQHKAAMRAIRRHHQIICRLEETPGYPRTPRVLVGHLLRGRDSNGEDIREPIYAYDHERITRDCNMWMSTTFGGPASAEKYRLKFAKHHRELTLLIRARNRFERKIGMPEARAAEKAAYDAETFASARLILARPTTLAEAKAKRRYIMGNAVMRDWSEGREAVHVVRDLSFEVVA
jgi:hypothetical protein